MQRQIVLIGAGQASASAARALRREGFDGKITIVGNEPYMPYQRPPLSKEYLLGDIDRNAMWALDGDWYVENDVGLELGRRAIYIDKGTLGVELDDGRWLGANAVLIATGGSARRLPGAEGGSILYLRTLDDADRIREAARKGMHLIVVGGGFIGSEVAASAKAMGAEVTVLELMKTPLERVLGDAIGAICGDIHRENGVKVQCSVAVKSIRTSGSGVVVETSEGGRISGDAVVVGIGIAPNVDIAKASEITVGNGIRVDEFCRTTDNGIFAAGDVANHYHPLSERRLRVEHFDNATRQGAVAAKNMMGRRTAYTDPHWFWSDQYGHSFQYVGHAEMWDHVVIRGSTEERDFTAFYIKDDRIAGAFGVNRGGEIIVIKRLLAERIRVDMAALQDDACDLSELVVESEEPEPARPADTDDGSIDGSFARVARSGQVREGQVRRFEAEGTEIAFARVNGRVYALHNLCTHLACHLAAGKIANGGLTCLCHGSVFDLQTGEPINPPATRSVKTYAVREIDGHIYVRID